MVSIRELAARLDDYLDQAARGETIVIAENGKPVAELRPHPVSDLDDRLAALARDGKVILPEKPFVLPEATASMRPGYSLSDVVIEERRADRLLG
jgi:prevent-host-death family protein